LRKVLRAVVHVDPDADHDVLRLLVGAGCLGQDACDLAALDQHVVGPLEACGDAGNVFDRLGHAEAGDQREQREPGRRLLGSQQD
jgi:hypothetical protein